LFGGLSLVVALAGAGLVASEPLPDDVHALHEDIARVLTPLRLRLSPAKTRIMHLSGAFDFFGFHTLEIAIRGLSPRA
jgi:RNA-directed DNA polymerase